LLISQYPQSKHLDNAYFQLADIDFQNQSYSAAVKGFTRLINEKPKSTLIPAALLRRAQSYYNLQVYEQAIVDFRKILTEYSDSPSAAALWKGFRKAILQWDVRKSLPGTGRCPEKAIPVTKNWKK
jgi:TolA-binding protein